MMASVYTHISVFVFISFSLMCSYSIAEAAPVRRQMPNPTDPGTLVRITSVQSNQLIQVTADGTIKFDGRRDKSTCFRQTKGAINEDGFIDSTFQTLRDNDDDPEYTITALSSGEVLAIDANQSEEDGSGGIALIAETAFNIVITNNGAFTIRVKGTNQCLIMGADQMLQTQDCVAASEILGLFLIQEDSTCRNF